MKLCHNFLYLSSLLTTFVSVALPVPAPSHKADKAEENTVVVPFDETMYNWSRTFAQVMHLTHEKHYQAGDAEKCMIKAIDNFLSCLDPHSNFLDPKTYKAILEATSGEFFGIGIILDATRQQKDKFLLVVDTIGQGPADSAGIKPLDKIIEIDGESLEGMSTDEATVKLRGQRHTKVHVKVTRDGQPDLLQFDILRDVIKEQSSACFYLPEQNVYYLSLLTFSENSIKQITKLLEKSKQQKAKALVLDLRNNSGGLLNSAIDIAGLFLQKDSLIVVTKNKSNSITQTYKTTRPPIANSQLPIFILINNYTASAAEILAGSLKEHSQAMAKKAGSKAQNGLMIFIVGSRSFGKGSVQEVIPVTNNCAVKITTSLYYLPHGVCIQGTGIEPDFAIDREFPPTEQMTWFNKFYGRESALPHSIKPEGTKTDLADKEKAAGEDTKPKKEPKQEKTWTERAKDMLNKDNQFRGTLTLANMLNQAQQASPNLVNNRQKAVNYLTKLYVPNKDLTLEEVTI